MNSNRLTLILAVALVLTLALGITLRPDATVLNWEFLPEMKRSPAMQAFEATDRFESGRAMQTPVAGTIPRGLMPLHFSASKEDAVRAGDELRNPYHESPASEPVANSDPASADNAARLAASVERGQSIYRVYCQSCHGASGAGDGPVAQRGFPPPPPLPTGKSVQMKDGQLFHILTYGQGSMQSMAAQLDRDERWDVINFVRSLQAKSVSTESTTPESTEANASPPTATEP